MAVRDYKEKNLTVTRPTMFLITPSDTVDLAVPAISLRIWNPEVTAQTIKIDTVGGDTVTLNVPVGLSHCDAYVARVYDTNSGDTLVIHGYNY